MFNIMYFNCLINHFLLKNLNETRRKQVSKIKRQHRRYTMFFIPLECPPACSISSAQNVYFGRNSSIYFESCLEKKKHSKFIDFLVLRFSLIPSLVNYFVGSSIISSFFKFYHPLFFKFISDIFEFFAGF